MGESPEIELVRRAWDALIAGGPEVLGEVLAPDAQWYGVEDGQLCDGREAIIDVMSRNLAGRLRGRVEEAIQDGSRVIVAFRPEQPAQLDRPVDEGIAYMVVTIRDGHIVEMKGCADRPAAVSYARSGGWAAPVSVVVASRVFVDERSDKANVASSKSTRKCAPGRDAPGIYPSPSVGRNGPYSASKAANSSAVAGRPSYSGTTAG